MPVHIAIVEDDTTASSTLAGYLKRYEAEHGVHFSVRIFDNALLFLDRYTAEFDLIYMDIQMPYMNGMDAAHKLREIDQNVQLVFVTSLMQYALEGYEVRALDYIVKPFSYYDFAMKLSRDLDFVPMREDEDILVPTDVGNVRLSFDSIRYVEVQGHHLVYHTRRGEFTQYGSMTKIEPKLEKHHFVRCNSCYLVNLHYVEGIHGYMVTVAGEELKISQPKKKNFVQAFEAYMEK